MTKIAFIGGGSVQWTPGLVNDMALTKTLTGAELVLHDIDAEALGFMSPVCKRIVDRQELIVEAALTGRYELAQAALASDPLIRDPQTVEPMFEELVAAAPDLWEQHKQGLLK